MTDDGVVDGWAERIMLKPTSFEGYDPARPVDEDEGPKTPTITVEIKRRA
jgi:hypothetical protein